MEKININFPFQCKTTSAKEKCKKITKTTFLTSLSNLEIQSNYFNVDEKWNNLYENIDGYLDQMRCHIVDPGIRPKNLVKTLEFIKMNSSNLGTNASDLEPHKSNETGNFKLNIYKSKLFERRNNEKALTVKFDVDTKQEELKPKRHSDPQTTPTIYYFKEEEIKSKFNIKDDESEDDDFTPKENEKDLMSLEFI